MLGGAQLCGGLGKTHHLLIIWLDPWVLDQLT